MYKILIVDDEMLARVGLASLIEWENYNMQVVGQAENGKIAYEMSLKLQPDIIITDIKMPLMNGVELIKKLKAKGYEGEFVVFSGFNDYEYVKEAMKAGAKDYILKLKLDKEELIDILQRIIKEKNKVKVDYNNFNVNRMEKLINNNIPIIKAESIKKLLIGDYKSIDTIKNKLAVLEVDLSGRQFICVSMRLESCELEKKYNNKDIHLLNSSIINIILNCIPADINYHIVNIQPRQYSILFIQNDGYGEQLNNWLRIIKNEFEKYLNINVIFGVSNTYTKLSKIKKAYEETKKAIDQVISSKNYIVFYNKIIESNDIIKVLEKLLKKFEKAYIEILEEDIEESLNQLILELKKINSISRQQLWTICIHIVYIIRVNEQLTQIYIEDIWKSKESYNNFEPFLFIEDYISWIQQLKTAILNNIKKLCHNHILNRAKKYIQDNFKEKDISLNKLSEILKVSPNYLSAIFKKELNMNYNEYLTKCRIEKAKIELRSTDKKIYIIAEDVGYGNVYYFSRIFKKVTGISPVQYRNNKSYQKYK